MYIIEYMCTTKEIDKTTTNITAVKLSKLNPHGASVKFELIHEFIKNDSVPPFKTFNK